MGEHLIIEQMKVGHMDVFCYLVGCGTTGAGLVIDPGGDEQRVLEKARSLNLRIEAVVSTHGHADHTCGVGKIAQLTGAKTYMHALDDDFFCTPQGRATGAMLGLPSAPRADVALKDDDIIAVGDIRLQVLHTPGHTPGSICLHMDNNVFTGDTLFVGEVGRTDLPGSSPDMFRKSFIRRILTLADDTIVWPGHDYGQYCHSTIGQEKKHNHFIRSLGVS